LESFLRLTLGATSLYLGGMFLNDACDVVFDREHRPERPIPGGLFSVREVWFWGGCWLLLGILCLALSQPVAFLLTACLTASILLYNATHKTVSFAPVLMGICRGILFLLAALAGVQGMDGYALWAAVTLGAYVAGLSWLPRAQRAPGWLRHWPVALLLVPVLLALLVNDGDYRQRGWLLAGVLVLWIVRSLRLGMPERSMVSLLAGIVLVDLLAVTGVDPENARYLVAFPGLFLLTLILQRFVPAS
jgi:4-hydroxybenzoate polyprenyltransferase